MLWSSAYPYLHSGLKSATKKQDKLPEKRISFARGFQVTTSPLAVSSSKTMEPLKHWNRKVSEYQTIHFPLVLFQLEAKSDLIRWVILHVLTGRRHFVFLIIINFPCLNQTFSLPLANNPTFSFFLPQFS